MRAISDIHIVGKHPYGKDNPLSWGCLFNVRLNLLININLQVRGDEADKHDLGHH